MIKVAVAHSSADEVGRAAEELCSSILDSVSLGGQPDVLITFASPTYDQDVLLGQLYDRLRPAIMVGASSSGEFSRPRPSNLPSGAAWQPDVKVGSACVLAIRSDEMVFNAGIGFDLDCEVEGAAQALASGLRGDMRRDYPHRAGLIMTDSLAGHANDLVDRLTLATAGSYRFFGGGAGDDGQFHQTRVFYGSKAFSNAAVLLEILSKKPLGIGAVHGWRPVSSALRVTAAEGMRLMAINGCTAVSVLEQHAQSLGQLFDREDPLPFFLHNVLGVDSGAGLRLRVPLSLTDEGAIVCAAEVPVGARLHFMRSDADSAADAALQATLQAQAALGPGRTPAVALFFDCVATRGRVGEAFGRELESLVRVVGENVPYIGCNTHGQIARLEGQLDGFHNGTAVVCLIPS